MARSRRLRTWHDPVAVLSRGQRKELLAAVRGRRPVAPDRLPLARLLAEQVHSQRFLLVSNVGLGVAFAGQWIAFPTVWRAVLAGVFAAGLVVAWALVGRDVRRAQRFLDDHPEPS